MPLLDGDLRLVNEVRVVVRRRYLLKDAFDGRIMHAVIRFVVLFQCHGEVVSSVVEC